MDLHGETNIVLIGETGVGKSTFINAFANYLKFDNLEQSQKSEPIVLIPTRFVTSDEDMNEIVITLGDSDPNEAENDGQSKTQSCKSYLFTVKGKTIRLIDTPGIGDTRGLEQDRKNLEAMMNFMMGYEKIHGICYLLQPNTSRLGPAFRAHFQEILGRLHISACLNIFFVFTNARSTSYKPGDTLPPLKLFLSELSQNREGVTIQCTQNFYFCMDNEAFRFLALIKNNIEFDREEIADFNRSWIKSSKESNRLIEQISKVNPHLIKTTVLVSSVKQIIKLLSQPIAQATIRIQNEIIDHPNDEALCQKLEEEQNTLNKLAANLVVFMQRNSINSSYDQIKADLEALNSEEEYKSKYDPDKHKLLQKLADNQENYGKLLEETKSEIKSLEDLKKIVSTLSDLDCTKSVDFKKAVIVALQLVHKNLPSKQNLEPEIFIQNPPTAAVIPKPGAKITVSLYILPGTQDEFHAAESNENNEKFTEMSDLITNQISSTHEIEIKPILTLQQVYGTLQNLPMPNAAAVISKTWRSCLPYQTPEPECSCHKVKTLKNQGTQSVVESQPQAVTIPPSPRGNPEHQSRNKTKIRTTQNRNSNATDSNHNKKPACCIFF